MNQVGLHLDHGYARRLGCFASNLGHVASQIASKKLEKSACWNLVWPWIAGEPEFVLRKPILIAFSSIQLSSSEAFSLIRSDKQFEQHEGDNLSQKFVSSTVTSLHAIQENLFLQLEPPLQPTLSLIE